MVPWYHVALLPLRLGTMTLWYHCTQMPYDDGTVVPRTNRILDAARGGPPSASQKRLIPLKDSELREMRGLKKKIPLTNNKKMGYDALKKIGFSFKIKIRSSTKLDCLKTNMDLGAKATRALRQGRCRRLRRERRLSAASAV